MSKFFVSRDNTDNCPCKGCIPPKRNSTCHSTCENFLTWDKNHREKLESFRKEKVSEDVYYQGAARRNKQLMQKGVSFGRGKK